jgi:hypothetical protein
MAIASGVFRPPAHVPVAVVEPLWTAIQSDHRVAESIALFFSARAGVMMLGHGFFSTLGQPMVAAGAIMAVLATTALAAEPTQVERVQAAIDAWFASRAPIEKITGIAAYISFGATGPAIEAFSGKVGRDPDARPVDQDTLYPRSRSP